jgi:uroporphyrinogen decarboxylase
MNSCERTASVLEGADLRPVPYQIHLLPDLVRELHARRGMGDVDELLGNDVRLLRFPSPKQYLPDGSWRDAWGVRWSPGAADRGAVLDYPLKEPSTKGLALPAPPDDKAIRDLASECAAFAHRYRVLWVGDLFERAQFLRSMEEVLVDMVENAAFLEELLDRIAALLVARVEAAARLDVDAVFISDDYGAQHGLLMSPALWRRMIRPRLERVFSAARRAGKKVFLHSCGKVDAIVGDLVDMGLDALHPVQPEAVDLPALVRGFGGKITFYGGVSTQRTLVSASPDDVRREVRAVCDLCGRSGRFILAPGISLQRDVPWANIEALIDAAKEWR